MFITFSWPGFDFAYTLWFWFWFWLFRLFRLVFLVWSVLVSISYPRMLSPLLSFLARSCPFSRYWKQQPACSSSVGITDGAKGLSSSPQIPFVQVCCCLALVFPLLANTPRNKHKQNKTNKHKQQTTQTMVSSIAFLDVQNANKFKYSFYFFNGLILALLILQYFKPLLSGEGVDALNLLILVESNLYVVQRLGVLGWLLHKYWLTSLPTFCKPPLSWTTWLLKFLHFQFHLYTNTNHPLIRLLFNCTPNHCLTHLFVWVGSRFVDRQKCSKFSQW